MCRFILYLLLFYSSIQSCTAQSGLEAFLTPSDTLNLKRKRGVFISEAALSGITLIGLNALWYADFERSKFRTVNDTKDWLQLDKFGHVFSAYQLGRYGATALRWSGASAKEQLLYGATLGFGFLTAVEILDGFSSEWGFSWGDVGANALGTGAYVLQHYFWQEQRIAIKFSFASSRFAALNPDQLGTSLATQIVKDYNGQTYWLSCNLHAFFKHKALPKWLNLAVGYGGDGLLSGNERSESQLLSGIERYRQYYLSLDIDLTRIPTKSSFLKTVFSVFNAVKVPFPAIEIGKKGLVFHPLR